MSYSDRPEPDLPLEIHGKAAVAYDHLKASAINGRLRPGRRLAPHDLAEYYHVSATPIRDAMVQLAIEGFIARESGRGFAVKPFELSDQRERHEMCFFYLSNSLDRLDELPQPLLDALSELDPEAIAVSDGAADRLAQLIEEVFDVVACASHNSLLCAQARVVVDQTHFVRLIDLGDVEARRRTAERLRRFAEAMLAGDHDLAREMFRDKLEARIQRMASLVREANLQASEARFP